MRRHCQYLVCLGAAIWLGLAVACAPSRSARTSGVHVVAVEAVYADIVRQIAGDAVGVTTIMDSPSADPHAYEPTARDADAIADADLVIENGLGYDAFADKLLAASPRAGRRVIVVGALAGRHQGDNPHVWYDTQALRLLTQAIVGDLGPRLPGGRRSLSRAAEHFDSWLDEFTRRTLQLGRRYRGTDVAVTEPVFDAMLRAASLHIVTPPAFSKAIEEGNDPAPQDVATMRELLVGHRVAVLIYNRQTIEPSTSALLALARSSGVPVVSVTETLPGGMDVQSWFDRQIDALAAALAAGDTSRAQPTSSVR